MRFTSLFLALFLLASPSLWAIPKKATAELLAASNGVAPGQSITLGLKLTIDDHWHTYWINPGVGGKPTTLTWELPEGYATSKLQQPVPTSFSTAGEPGYGYEHEVIHPLILTAPANAEPGTQVTLNAKGKWLTCDDKSCLPGSADVSITLSILNPEEIKPSPHAAEIARYAPPKTSPTALQVKAEGDRLLFDLGTPVPAEATIYVETRGIVNVKDAPVLEGSTISIAKDEYFDALPEETALLVVLPDGAAARYSTAPDAAAALAVSAPAAAADEAAQSTSTPEPTEIQDAEAAALPTGNDYDRWLAKQMEAVAEIKSWGLEGEEKELSLFLVLLFAFIGGIILNLMPCVFPVIGVKIMGFVQQAGEDTATVKKHGLVFGAGVLLSLWALAGVIVAIRLAGDQVGWGFQLQNPIFVLVMTLVLFVFGLNLTGLFEFGTSLVGAGQDLQTK